jgi:hypothetical protein
MVGAEGHVRDQKAVPVHRAGHARLDPKGLVLHQASQRGGVHPRAHLLPGLGQPLGQEPLPVYLTNCTLSLCMGMGMGWGGGGEEGDGVPVAPHDKQRAAATNHAVVIIVQTHFTRPPCSPLAALSACWCTVGSGPSVGLVSMVDYTQRQAWCREHLRGCRAWCQGTHKVL